MVDYSGIMEKYVIVHLGFHTYWNDANKYWDTDVCNATLFCKNELPGVIDTAYLEGDGLDISEWYYVKDGYKVASIVVGLKKILWGSKFLEMVCNLRKGG